MNYRMAVFEKGGEMGCLGVIWWGCLVAP